MGIFSQVGFDGSYSGIRDGMAGSWSRAQAGARGYAAGHMAGRGIASAQKFAGSRYGQAIGKGFGEAFGFNYSNGGRSFLGGKETINAFKGGGIRKGLGSLATKGGLGLGFTAIMAYQGYKEEGLWGATKNIAESALWNIGPRAAGIAFGSLASVMLPTAVIGTAAVGAVAFQRNAAEYNKKLRRT